MKIDDLVRESTMSFHRRYDKRRSTSDSVILPREDEEEEEQQMQSLASIMRVR
jgi:hypothetical protein